MQETAPRKRPKQARATVTVDAILDAAAQLLVAGGYLKLTTNRVAARAGVSIGTLYQYFPTKDAVIAALVERHIDRVRVALTSRLAEVRDAPLAPFLRGMIGGLFDAHAVDPALHRVMLEQIPRVGRSDRLAALTREMQLVVSTCLAARMNETRRARNELAALVAVRAATTMAHAAVFDAALRGEQGALVEEVTDLVLRYLIR